MTNIIQFNPQPQAIGSTYSGVTLYDVDGVRMTYLEIKDSER